MWVLGAARLVKLLRRVGTGCDQMTCGQATGPKREFSSEVPKREFSRESVKSNVPSESIPTRFKEISELSRGAKAPVPRCQAGPGSSG